MPELIADGKPFEPSLDTANDVYASTPPSFNREVQSLFDESPVSMGERATQRGEYAGSSWFDRYLATTGMANAGLVVPQPIQSPELTADEANNWYAPPGTKITDKPISQGLAQVIGRQKREEIERENVIARAQSVHTWPRNFIVGLAVSALDPINLSTMFVPGVGEEAVTAALGRGALARVGGRVVAGATGAAAAQVPLSALRYGLSQEEAGDYSAREALTDVFYGAAGGAILQSGFGALGDLIRARRGIAERPPTGRPAVQPADTAPILTPNAETNAAAMRASISQVLEGRMVDVLPVVDANSVKMASREAELRTQADQLALQLTALPKTEAETAAVEKLSRLQAVERNLAEEGISVEQRRELLRRKDEILASTTPEKLQAEAAPAETRRNIENQKAQIEDQIRSVVAQQLQARLDQAGPPAGIKLSNLADSQRQVYRNGYASSVPQSEFNATNEEVYGPKPPEAEKPPAEKAAPKEKPPTAGAAPAKPTTPEEKDAADLEAQWQRVQQTAPVKLTPEQIAEIQGAVDEYAKAQSRSLGLGQAGACLSEAGV